MATPTKVPAPGSLRLYKMETQEDYPGIVAQGFINMKQNSPADSWKVGLREDPQEAVEREQKIADKEGRGPVSKHTHFLCEVTFTALGVAYYTMLYKGQDYHFQPTLVKKAYGEDYGCGHDWKVWHFFDNLPLNVIDVHGNVLVTTEFKHIA